jgi:phospholipase/lecithinase/hemolysin
MRNLILVLAAVVALVLTQGVAGAATIVNGGFETGDFFGWTLTGNTGSESVSTSYVYNGTYAAKLGQVGSIGYIAQDISTNPGSTYQVGFWLSNAAGGAGSVTPNLFEMLINNASYSTTFHDFPVAFPYANFTASFVATTATTNVKFGFREDPSYWYLDEVTINDTTVPEPATFVLIGAGLIGLAVIGRRRRA